jgi:hypothetical protein
MGKKRIVIIPNLAFNSLIIKRPQENWGQVFLKEIASNLNLSFSIFRRGMEYLFKREKILPHYVIMDNFVNSILGREKLLIPPEEGLEAIRVLEEVDRELKLTSNSSAR